MVEVVAVLNLSQRLCRAHSCHACPTGAGDSPGVPFGPRPYRPFSGGSRATIRSLRSPTSTRNGLFAIFFRLPLSGGIPREATRSLSPPSSADAGGQEAAGQSLRRSEIAIKAAMVVGLNIAHEIHHVPNRFVHPHQRWHLYRHHQDARDRCQGAPRPLYVHEQRLNGGGQHGKFILSYSPDLINRKPVESRHIRNDLTKLILDHSSRARRGVASAVVACSESNDHASVPRALNRLVTL
ncbi:hypothetical protein FBZ94_10218 [Bradyrhizobium sacchari]|uniref:Uncharacterized protein n=1 Tax=Bradyrhizobium sacchari TaxID=1399419 RepID=A0A560IZN0_9BRAD|nr:hypothetical protein FBZ94_10218 [Bradyrhizobium sacchari]TWB80801.1 hypothetical protein FBZ95_10218 [Bradyrhizobium sacchari]